MLHRYNLKNLRHQIVGHKFIVIMAMAFFLFSCKSPGVKPPNYNYTIERLIFSNQILKGTFHKIFDEDPENRIFKVLISRRDHFVRITIYRVLNKDEVNESPSTYFINNSKVFLCYDGTEVIENKKVDDNFMRKLKQKMDIGMINDSRVFQFDIDSQKKITLHVPAINPYDFSFGPCRVDFSNKKR
ncbi:hypothetical protein [Mucilaginibacter sp.]|uniref:hypothetical protein n=1 Tax=Mucilaginibacter sp. TaxID=1882438 RepID=UPI0028480B93|nr:hypothetical protein [Mucilaginibacter sp.]MDR3694586.1 hypothetical protein [Mucilaginibacter sp.]